MTTDLESPLTADEVATIAAIAALLWPDDARRASQVRQCVAKDREAIVGLFGVEGGEARGGK